MERIESRRNKLIAHMKRLSSDNDYRALSGEMLCDGPKLLREALSSGVPVRALICVDSSVTNGMSFGENCRIAEAPEHILSYISGVKTPQGVVFSCAMPETALPEKPEAGKYILLDGLQDPGNVGGIIRTAAAFGINAVILINACADPFGPKAVRASMGACFRQKIIECSAEEAVRTLKKAGISLYAAENRPEAVDISNLALTNAAIVVGSEGNGLSAELRGLCTGSVKIPVAAECESLNAAVAAALFMYEMRCDNVRA